MIWTYVIVLISIISFILYNKISINGKVLIKTIFWPITVVLFISLIVRFIWKNS